MSPTTDTERPRRKLLTRDQRQAVILSSAAHAFARTGYSATSMDDVARASGVTKLILYRNFESKEALYRSVLESVSTRLSEVFVAELEASRRPAGARTLLTVAREEPDGFVLLWRHAVREPRFADYALEFRGLTVQVTRDLISPRVQDPTLLEWAANALVSWNVESVLAWLEHGDRERDDEFLDLARTTVTSMLATWTDG
ncbi:MAG: TetR/AcrR family transcriptional regulator [Acidimicrobiales bacterium]